MYKLKILQGLEEPKEFILDEGTHILGRGTECNIVIPSSVVSKKHAIITVNHHKVMIEDLESKNGTFVNGIMVQKKELKLGDRISFQNIVLELTPTIDMSRNISGATSKISPLFEPPPPSSQKPSLFQQLMNPLFSSAVQVIDWKYLTLFLFLGFILFNFSITLPQLLDTFHEKLQLEAIKRGEFIVKQISAQNQKNITLKNDLLVADTLAISTDLAQQEDRILLLNIIDPKTKKIIAPPERLEQSIDTKAAFLRGSEAKKLALEKINNNQILISQPIYLYSSTQDRDVVGAVVQAVFNLEGIGMSASEKNGILVKFLIFSMVLGIIFYFLLQQFTSAAIRQIYTEIEAASKKGFQHLELKTKFEEINQIIHSINKTFKKTRDLMSKLSQEELGKESLVLENTDEILNNLLRVLPDGLVVLNNNYHIIRMNPVFQKMANLRNTDLLNKNILDLIQEETLLKNITHGLGQASFGMSTSEDIEWGDHKFHLSVSATKNPNNEIDFYIIDVRQVE